MSFSASWDDVRADDAAEDLTLEKATLSPPLESLDDEVKARLDNLAVGVLAEIVRTTPAGPTGRFRVTASGHLRQGELDPSYVSIGVSELLDEPGA